MKMKVKYTFLLLSLFLFGSLDVKGQSCDELYKKGMEFLSKNKQEAAEKCFRQMKDGDCDPNTKKKAENYLKPIEASHKKSVKTTIFSLSEENVDIPYYGGEYLVHVSGTNSWEVAVESDWCFVRKDGKSFVIECRDANQTMKKRIANVIVTSGSRSKTVVVTNGGAPEMLRCSAGNINFSAKGDSNIVDVYTNTNWQLDSVPNWVDYAVINDNRIVLRTKANQRGVERYGNVVISTPSSKTTLIKICQGAGDEQLSSSKNNLSFGPDGGEEYVRVFTETEELQFDYPSWCDVKRISDDSIRIECKPNAQIEMVREGFIYLKTGIQTLGINIIQEAKPFPYRLPSMGIGGRALSFGVNAGYLLPIISTSSDGDFTGSVVNYALGNNNETASYSVSGGFTFDVFADIRIYKNIYLIAGVNYLQYSYKNKLQSNMIHDYMLALPNHYGRGKIQDYYTENYSLKMMEFPVLASYRFPVTKVSHIQINVGPVISCGLSCKMKIEGFSDGENLTAYKISNGQKTDVVDESVTLLPRHIKSEGHFNLYSNEVDYSETFVESNEIISKSQSFDAAPFRRLNFGVQFGLKYEYKGIGIGVTYSHFLTNMANEKYWEGSRWTIFDQVGSVMKGFKQRNNYLQIKIGYTFRY